MSNIYKKTYLINNEKNIKNTKKLKKNSNKG